MSRWFSVQQVYGRRRARGLCIRCGAETNGFVCCFKCRLKEAIRKRNKKKGTRSG